MRTVTRVVLSARLLPLHLLALAAVTTAVLLGVWQYGAWEAQREAAARDLSELPAVALEEVLSPDDPFLAHDVGRPVTVSGSWVPEATFLVSDRPLGEREGYWVVTPLAVCEEEGACVDRAAQRAALLVVRGWTGTPADAPEPPRGDVALTGWLQPPEGTGRPDPDPGDDVLPELRIADAIQRVDQDLYGAYLVAERGRPSSATRGLVPVPPNSVAEPGAATGLRNLFYAVEWWVFAAFAGFVWWRWTRDESERVREADAVSDADGPEVRSSP